jgi:hypothetical protein
MRFQNPTNGYIEKSDVPWLWCLIFGCFYFAAKGIWWHAFLSFLIILIAVILCWRGGVAVIVFAVPLWCFYPLFAPNIVRTHYLRNGWFPVE